MIKLKELIEASIDPKLVARSKESGKLVYFKTPQAKDAAMKAGTHLDPKAKKGAQPKADAKPNNMFGADYSKDRGGDTKIQAFKSADGSDVGPNKYTTAISKIRPSDSSMKIKPTFGPDGTEGSFGNATKDDFYNAGETLRQMGWTPDDIAKRIGDNLPDIDDEKDIPQMQDSDDKEDWINLYKKSIAMKKAGYTSSEIADKLRANL
jgi:hypothetical protein